MKSTSFKEVNAVLGAGGNPNTDQLPVAISTAEGYPKGIVFHVSKFKLSEEELEHVKKTGEVWVAVMGTSMPPILPTVYNPFEYHGFKPFKIE